MVLLNQNNKINYLDILLKLYLSNFQIIIITKCTLCDKINIKNIFCGKVNIKMEKYKILISDYTYDNYKKSQIPPTALDKYRSSFVLLFNDGWNDMGFYSEFWILYVDNKAFCERIGQIKLCNKEMKLDNIYPYNEAYYFLKNDNLIERELSSNILNNYYSIINIDIYDSLLKILKEDTKVSKFLSELNEVSTLSNDTINEIKNYDWFKESILRDFGTSVSKNDLIVSFTELKNKLKNENTTYYFLNKISTFFNSLSEDDSKEVYGWFENISFAVANEVVNIIAREDISNFTNKDMLKNILNDLKIKFESYTHFVQKIDAFLNLNEDFYDSIEKIKEILKVTEEDLSELELGHYTSLSTIPNLIKTETSYLRLTNGRQMNDPLEGKYLSKYILGDINNSWKPTNHFISSLTTKKDSLPMWNNYAEGATGAMLIYDKEYLKKISRLEYIDIYKIVYIHLDSDKNIIEIDPTNNLSNTDIDQLKEKINSIKNESNNLKTNQNEERVYINKLQEIEFLFKKRDYSYESEYRIVVNTEMKNEKLEIRTEKNHLLNFPFLYCYLKEIELKYSKLILGSKAINIDYIAPYINHCDANIELNISKINFR